jgi:toxin YoeB
MVNETWKILYTKQGLKDKQKAIENGFGQQVDKLLALVKENPFSTYPPYEKLIGDLSGAYSRRINRQHRFVYQVYSEECIVKVISMWTHYE